ncbi:MAG: response regulator [Limisphaerales bacterium]
MNTLPPMLPTSPARILIVEDEGIIAQDIEATLEKLGYEVSGIAAVGEEAIEMAAELRPNLVLMDIVLWGGMDGVEAAKQIRERLHIPVIFLTAHSDTATLQRAKVTGPHGYLVKPLVERELRISIEMALHKHSMERRLAEQQQWFATTLASIGEAVIATDTGGGVCFMNSLAESITGLSQAQAVGRPLDQVMVLSAEVAPGGSHGPYAEAMRKGLVIEWAGNTALFPRLGPSTPIDYTATRIREEDGSVAGVVVVFRDITPRRQMEEDRERLIRELRAAAENVRTLRGLLPVCASCKKIRDDHGYWQAVDAYIVKQGLGQVSHGMCPECIRKLYPTLAEEILAEISESECQPAPEAPVPTQWTPRP